MCLSFLRTGSKLIVKESCIQTLIKVDIIDVIASFEKFESFRCLSAPNQDFCIKVCIYLSSINDFKVLRNEVINFITLLISPLECEFTNYIESTFLNLIEDEYVKQRFETFINEKEEIKKYLQILKNDETCEHQPSKAMLDFVNELEKKQKLIVRLKNQHFEKILILTVLWDLKIFSK